MKFSCEKNLLQAAVMTASRAAAPKSPIPALEGLLIKAETEITVTGYNLKKGIFTRIEGDISEEGAAVFNARLFVEMIRKLPDGNVLVEVGADNNARLKCGRSEYSFMAINAEDYPELPAIEKEQSVAVPQKLLAEMINETVFAVSTNESRPVYMGSLFEVEKGELAIISVDGYRLALRREKLEGSETTVMSFIVPGSALTDIERICEGTEDAALINLGAKHVSFTIGDTVIISRRLEGEFLNYKKAIPENFRATMKVSRSETLAIVDRVAIIIDEKIRNPVRLTFCDGSIHFLCATPLGRAEDVCFSEGNGGEVEIGFNDKYLRDALRAAPADDVNICINTGSSPCVIFPANGSDKFAYMILPVRLRSGT